MSQPQFDLLNEVKAYFEPIVNGSNDAMKADPTASALAGLVNIVKSLNADDLVAACLTGTVGGAAQYLKDSKSSTDLRLLKAIIVAAGATTGALAGNVGADAAVGCGGDKPAGPC